MGVLDRAIAESVPVIPRPIVRRISRRYIAGDTLDEAVETVRALNHSGCVATIDVLGESTESKADAAATLRDYKKVIDALDRYDLRSGISVKLTGLGLTLNKELCRANLEEIVSYAAEKNRFVRVDMEDSPYTGVTLEMVVDLHERHENVGAVIQAYMRLIHQLGVPKDRYEFQMLLGVDEELRRILVGAGHKLRVYVPFGEDWYEYSSRRLKENPKIAGYVARDVLGSLKGNLKG